MKTKNNKKKTKQSNSKKTDYGYKNLINGVLVFSTFIIVFLDSLIPLFMEFFPIFSVTLALLAVSGENIKDLFIVGYSIYLLFFIFTKYKKYGNGNGKGKGKGKKRGKNK